MSSLIVLVGGTMNPETSNDDVLKVIRRCVSDGGDTYADCMRKLMAMTGT